MGKSSIRRGKSSIRRKVFRNRTKRRINMKRRVTKRRKNTMCRKNTMRRKNTKRRKMKGGKGWVVFHSMDKKYKSTTEPRESMKYKRDYKSENNTLFNEKKNHFDTTLQNLKNKPLLTIKVDKTNTTPIVVDEEITKVEQIANLCVENTIMCPFSSSWKRQSNFSWTRYIPGEQYVGKTVFHEDLGKGKIIKYIPGLNPLGQAGFYMEFEGVVSDSGYHPIYHIYSPLRNTDLLVELNMYDFNTLFCRGDKLLPPLSILLKAVNWNGEVDDLPGIYNHIKNSATEIPSHSNSILLELQKRGKKLNVVDCLTELKGLSKEKFDYDDQKVWPFLEGIIWCKCIISTLDTDSQYVVEREYLLRNIYIDETSQSGGGVQRGGGDKVGEVLCILVICLCLYGIVKLGMAMISILSMLSDLRVKQDIKRIDTSPTRIPIYTWRYKKGFGYLTTNVYCGTIAQDLLSMGRRDAVVMGNDGYYRVDYSKLDVSFKRLT